MSRLLAAYRRSTYRMGPITVRVGRRCPAMDMLLRISGVRAAVLIGAWNPLSRRMPTGWNRRMEARLSEHLRRHCWLESSGGAGRWWEAHVLLLGDPRPAVVLARLFRQCAVVVLRRGQKARLVVVRENWHARLKVGDGAEFHGSSHNGEALMGLWPVANKRHVG